MIGSVNFNSGRQDQRYHPDRQPLSNGQYPSWTSPLVPPRQVVQKIGPLPPDHPLKVEMEELKQTRKKRQYYWAGLIEDLGEDEWENLANYDRQRWEEENRLADQRLEELAGQIKLAEMGIIDNSTHPEFPQFSFGAQEYNKPEHSNGRTKRRRASRLRALERGSGRGHSTNPQTPTNQRPGGQNFKIFKVQHIRPPPKHPRGSIIWTEDRKMEAVQKWMDEMGMNRNPTSEESKGSSGLGSLIDPDENMSNGGYSRSDDTYRNDINHSPLRFPEQEELVIDDTGSRAVRNNHTKSEAAELSVEPLWTAEEDAIFEEAEAAREAHRIQLARLTTVENERREVLDPCQKTHLRQDEHRSGSPAKDIAIPSVRGAKGTATDNADLAVEAQWQNPRALMINRAEQIIPTRDGESIMGALLNQLGTSQLNLRDLARAATRDLEEPPLSTIMAEEGSHLGLTAATGLEALAPAATQDVQKPEQATGVAREGEQSGLSAEENVSGLVLAESQILAEFEQSLSGTPREEQPDVSAVDDLRASALTVTQRVGDSGEPYVETTTREQIDAFTLEDLQALALAVTKGIEEAEQCPKEESPVEEPAALTVLDMQALALIATSGPDVPESRKTLVSDAVQREVTIVGSAFTASDVGEDQGGAEVIVKKSKGGFQERPVAADFMDFMDVDTVLVETVDMQDVPGSDSEITDQLAADCDDMKRSNDPATSTNSAPELGAASTNDGPHTLFVGILPKDVTKVQLEELFSGFHM